MPSLFSKPLSKFERLPETWLVAIAPMRTWITPPNKPPIRPWVILVLSVEHGTIRGSDIAQAPPKPQAVCDVLLKAMRKPAPGGGAPGVPRAIGVPDAQLADALIPLLTKEGLETKVFVQPPPDQVAEIIRDLEAHMRGGEPEPPAMLSVKGVTPELVGRFFTAAAEFYRAAPWVHLSNFQVLAIRHPAAKDYRYTIVMGHGGVEYGLATYLRWKDVERLYTHDDHPLETIPDIGAHSLNYEEITRMPFDDLDAIQKYGWEIAADDAYPLAAIFEKTRTVRRPAPIDYLWYEAALRAIPILVRDYLKPDGRGDYQPLEMSLDVPTPAGNVRVAVKYPAGKVPIAEMPAQTVDWSESEEEKEEEAERLPFFDRRVMEGVMSRELRKRGMEVGTGNRDLDRAQEMMYRAWEETNPAKRLALAHDALAISADCADAYVLLAEEEADTVSRALEYYQQGVAAGERALGAKFFKEHVGDFWGIMETRPYMRARRGLADTLWRLNRKDEALEHYREMLRLNPGDNQGNRYLLVDLLLQMDRDAELHELLKEYRDEWSATWLYTRALLAFRKWGDSDRARKVLGKALKQNPRVPAYLMGQKRIPNRLPELIGMGDENEAISYAADHLNHWRRTPGAVAWLEKQI